MSEEHDPYLQVEALEAALTAAHAENERLRAALIQSGRAAGAGLSDIVSTEFLMLVPGEVEARIATLRAELAGARNLVSRAQIVGQELPTGWHKDAKDFFAAPAVAIRALQETPDA